ncbi:MAG: formate dehydrogenase subunit alpha [Rectinemataceae bacterium]
MLSISIDGKRLSVPEGSTILDAARGAGISIPTLCHIDGLEKYGGCRLCMVEVEGSRSGVQAACTTPVFEGMVVHSSSPEVIDLRKSVLSMILAEHPADCFNCKKMGECRLHEYCAEYGLVKIETGLEKTNFPPDVSNPFFSLDRNKCILCGKCVRTCESLQCSDVLCFAGRGRSARISPAFDLPMGKSECVSCGNCVAACPVGALLPRDRAFPGAQYVRKVKSVCPYCGVGCRIELLLKGNRIVGVKGDQDGVNEGLLCVKGRFAYGFVGHPDRLTMPLLRKDGVLVEVEWEEAFEAMLSALKRTVAGSGPDAAAGLSSARCTNEKNYLFQKFFRAAVGTNNVDHCARLCHASTVAGLARSLGSGAMTNSIPEILDHDVIFVTGSNTTETHPIIGARIKRAVNSGARLIVADPRAIELADRAEVFIRLSPGSNVALYSAMANVIIAEGLADGAYIAARTEGFSAFAAQAAACTPELAASICGVDAEDIRKAARLYANAAKAGIYYAMGVTQHSTGTEGVLALSNLALLCGKVGKPGCGINPLRGQNNVQGACDMGALPGDYPGYAKVADPRARSYFSERWGASLPENPGLASTELIEAAAEGKIGFLYIMGENPALSEPDSKLVARALGKIDFLVVQDIFSTETAEFADLVLPAACFAEKDGTFTNTDRRVQRLRKAVAAPGEARDDLSILLELLRRMGKPDSAADAAGVFAELASETPQYRGMTWERLDVTGIQWPCPESGHPGTKVLHEKGFAGNGGKALFVPVEWKPPFEPADEEFPLVLTTGRNLYQYHTRTMTGRIEGLTRISGEAYAEMHPQTAAAYGLADNSMIRLSSRRGDIQVRLRVRAHVKPGVVFVPFHYSRSPANRLTHALGLDPYAKIPAFKVSAVRASPGEADRGASSDAG